MAISGPIPPFNNPPIQPQFFQPSQFVITAITLGLNTTITTQSPHNYVIGQLIRLNIPAAYGSFQLNQITGYVLSLPSTTQVLVGIDSTKASAFIASPYTATITGATQASQCVVTASNSFGPFTFVTITGVTGMTELNASNLQIIAVTPTTFTLNLNSTTFGAYVSGGIATLQVPQVNFPQIVGIGDINSGVTSSTGASVPTTTIPGSFINTSI